MKIVLGSISPSKLDITKKVLGELLQIEFSVEVFDTPSGVPDTPWDKETIMGAINRATRAHEGIKGADCWIGLESGLVRRYGDIYEEVWACIVDKNGNKYLGYSSGLKLPNYAIRKMEELDMAHGPTMKFIREEMGWENNHDTWGTYTNNTILREVSLEEALRNTAIQVFSPGTLYRK